MHSMTDGTRIHAKTNGTFDAEAVVKGETVWKQTRFSTRDEAQRAAEKAYQVLEEHR
jgi:dsRNA-specific ribonuclease